MAIDTKLRKKIFERDNNKCQTPGCTSDSVLTLDHIVPKAHGGRDTEDNLQVLCADCNREKGHSLHFSIWRRLKYLWVAGQEFADFTVQVRGLIAVVNGHIGKIQRTINQAEKIILKHGSKIGVLEKNLAERKFYSEKTISELKERIEFLEKHLGLQYTEEVVKRRYYKRIEEED